MQKYDIICALVILKVDSFIRSNEEISVTKQKNLKDLNTYAANSIKFINLYSSRTLPESISLINHATDDANRLLDRIKRGLQDHFNRIDDIRSFRNVDQADRTDLDSFLDTICNNDSNEI